MKAKLAKGWYAFWMCFGMFCGIPCPVQIWDEDARPDMIACLPLVGGVIGGCTVGIYALLRRLGLPWAAVMTAAPWLLSGCIHLDGYMDCCDAVFSRREQKKRQEILKDPHVGSFAVAGTVLLALLSYELWRGAEAAPYLPLALIPVASRACAAVAVTCKKPMETSQYAGRFARGKRGAALWLPAAALALCAAACLLPGGGLSMLAIPACCGGYWLAALTAARNLGGMSGDVSGFALTVGELCGLAALTLLN